MYTGNTSYSVTVKASNVFVVMSSTPVAQNFKYSSVSQWIYMILVEEQFEIFILKLLLLCADILSLENSVPNTHRVT